MEPKDEAQAGVYKLDIPNGKLGSRYSGRLYLWLDPENEDGE